MVAGTAGRQVSGNQDQGQGYDDDRAGEG